MSSRLNMMPLGSRVLVRLVPEGEKVRGWIVLPDVALEPENGGRAVVVRLSPKISKRMAGAAAEDRLEVGDEVFLERYSSGDRGGPGLQLRLVDVDEILCMVV